MQFDNAFGPVAGGVCEFEVLGPPLAWRHGQGHRLRVQASEEHFEGDTTAWHLGQYIGSGVIGERDYIGASNGNALSSLGFMAVGAGAS